MRTGIRLFGLAVFVAAAVPPLAAQVASVKPGINQSFENPEVTKFVERFEKEGREVYDGRNKIVEVLRLAPGMVVADVGAGTGLFSRLIAPQLGSDGKLYAVDIAKSFVDHTVQSCHALGWKHVEGIVCTADDSRLPENAIDLAFICDTYHHFEFPMKTMASIHRALKPGGRLVLVDFERIPGVSSDWILEHVRAGKETVIRELESCGFKLEEDLDLMKDNFVVSFRKPGTAAAKP